MSEPLAAPAPRALPALPALRERLEETERFIPIHSLRPRQDSPHRPHSSSSFSKAEAAAEEAEREAERPRALEISRTAGPVAAGRPSFPRSSLLR